MASISGFGGTGTWILAIAPIDLPFAKYAIVNARVLLRSDLLLLPAGNDIFMNIGYDAYNKTSGLKHPNIVGGGSHLVVTPDINFVSVCPFGILPANTPTPARIFEPPLTSSVLLEVDNLRRSTTILDRYVPYFRILLRQRPAGEPTLNIYIQGIEIFYRIKEY